MNSRRRQTLQRIFAHPGAPAGATARIRRPAAHQEGPVSRRTYPSRRHTDGPQLSVYDPKEELPVSKFPLSILPEANPSINCFQALDYLLVPTVNPFASSLMI